ncbi:serine/threonine-protein phosphatase 7 long form homolog [Aegilops tauschii subsp. strangulata]
MTVTLQDIAMITGLPNDGNPLCMNTDSDGWRAQMHALIGMVPPEPREPEAEDKKKERVAAGATFTWISSNFSHCPEDANEDMVKTYARVYMWYVISRTMFADGTGKNAPWMWLKALTVFDSKWSWGSATLAYLYRQLDEACCRHTGGIGGCLLALSIWSWERLPVGRPKTVKYEDWDDKDDPLRLPTWAYKWDVLNETTDDPSVMYKLYKSELDAITPEQVEWEPYGKGESFGNPMEFRLNPMCTRDRDLWHMRCPLICNWAVELHLPHRVFRQFGLFQPHPSEWEDTDKLLHALDRKKQRKINDWAKHHSKYVVQFALSVEQARAGKRAQLREHCPIAFNNYLTWFLASTRVEVCQPAYAEEILEEPTVFDEVAQHQYNALVRKGNSVIPSAPMMNFVRAQIKKAADETETILETAPAGKSDGEGALRAFIKCQGQKLRRLPNLFGCRDPEYVSPERSRSATPSDPPFGQGHGEPFEDEYVGVVTQEPPLLFLLNCELLLLLLPPLACPLPLLVVARSRRAQLRPPLPTPRLAPVLAPHRPWLQPPWPPPLPALAPPARCSHYADRRCHCPATPGRTRSSCASRASRRLARCSYPEPRTSPARAHSYSAVPIAADRLCPRRYRAPPEPPPSPNDAQRRGRQNPPTHAPIR